jgi:hypothetical protein
LITNVPPPTSALTGEKIFRKILFTASKHSIPAGYRKDFRPGMPRENLANERDLLQESDPQDPEISRLNTLIKEVITRENKKTWIKTVEDSHPRVSMEKHWRLLRILSGKRPHQPPNQPITFLDKSFSRPSAIALRFCRQFTSVTTHKSNKRSRRVNRNLKKKYQLDTTFKPFTDQLTKRAILMSLNSSAFGPDGLTSLHLKFLGPLGIAYLTSLF